MRRINNKNQDKCYDKTRLIRSLLRHASYLFQPLLYLCRLQPRVDGFHQCTYRRFITQNFFNLLFVFTIQPLAMAARNITLYRGCIRSLFDSPTRTLFHFIKILKKRLTHCEEKHNVAFNFHDRDNVAKSALPTPTRLTKLHDCCSAKNDNDDADD